MSEVACPECGHQKVHADFTCHTWPSTIRPDGTEQWMACQGCDSAIEYSCGCWLDDEVPDPDNPGGLWIYRDPECECNWDYTQGLNPRNPRWAREQESRPDWLPGADVHGDVLKIPGVPWAWESEEVAP